MSNQVFRAYSWLALIANVVAGIGLIVVGAYLGHYFLFVKSMVNFGMVGFVWVVCLGD